MNIFTYTTQIDAKSSGIRTVRDLKTALNSSGYDTESVKLILSDGKLVAPDASIKSIYNNYIVYIYYD